MPLVCSCTPHILAKAKQCILIHAYDVIPAENPYVHFDIDYIDEKIVGLTTLANENYLPAYLPYAEMLIQSGNSTGAKKYLRLSVQNGVNVQKCSELLEILEN